MLPRMAAEKKEQSKIAEVVDQSDHNQSQIESSSVSIMQVREILIASLIISSQNPSFDFVIRPCLQGMLDSTEDSTDGGNQMQGNVSGDIATQTGTEEKQKIDAII